MSKKQQKWIALLVTVTFIWLLQASALPLAAAGATERVSSAGTEQGPSFIEQEGASGYQARKKNIVPMILIGVGVAAVAAVLFLVVLKTKYDPVGTWMGNMSNQIPQTWTATVVFSGDKKSGTSLYADPWESDRPGTYTVDGKNITFTAGHASGHGTIVTFTGSFESKNVMTGTWQNNSDPTVKGPWKLVRQ